MIILIIGGSASQKLAANVAKELGETLCPLETKKFPDGERYVRIKGEVEKNVTVIQSTGFPQDENLIELLFILRTLKDLGAEHIKVVVPYLGYGRQELRFKDGEAISAQLVANLIEESGADEFISINLHEDSVRDFFTIPTANLSAMPPIAEYIKDIYENGVLTDKVNLTQNKMTYTGINLTHVSIIIICIILFTLMNLVSQDFSLMRHTTTRMCLLIPELTICLVSAQVVAPSAPT